MMTRALIGMTLVLTLTGCATSKWQKDGATVRDFEMDKSACSFAARSAGDPILAMLGLGDCLKGKGWEQVRQ